MLLTIWNVFWDIVNDLSGRENLVDPKERMDIILIQEEEINTLNRKVKILQKELDEYRHGQRDSQQRAPRWASYSYQSYQQEADAVTAETQRQQMEREARRQQQMRDLETFTSEAERISSRGRR